MPNDVTLYLSMDVGGEVDFIWLRLEPSFRQREYFENHFFLTKRNKVSDRDVST